MLTETRSLSSTPAGEVEAVVKASACVVRDMLVIAVRR